MRLIRRFALGCGVLMAVGLGLLVFGVVRAVRGGEAEELAPFGEQHTAKPKARSVPADPSLVLDRQRLAALMRRIVTSCASRPCKDDRQLFVHEPDAVLLDELRALDLRLVRMIEERPLSDFERPRATDEQAADDQVVGARGAKVGARANAASASLERCLSLRREGAVLTACAVNQNARDGLSEAPFRLLQLEHAALLAGGSHTSHR